MEIFEIETRANRERSPPLCCTYNHHRANRSHFKRVRTSPVRGKNRLDRCPSVRIPRGDEK